MKRWKIAALTFVVSVALCVAALFVLGGAKGLLSGDSLTLWYIQGDCSQPQLERLKAKYNYSFLSGRQKLALRAFESEEALAAAFGPETPDLLLCSSTKTADLYGRGLLSDAGLCGDGYTEGFDAKGCFLPLGSRLSLLMLNDAMCAAAGIETDFDSFEALTQSCKAYTKATGKAFLSASSYADLVDAELFSLGAPFSGDMRNDLKDDSFTYVYNLLADCGYSGSLLALGPSSAAGVAEGSLACACVRSDELAGLDAKGVTVRALPLPEGGEWRYPAELMGLAVTAKSEKSVSEAAEFLSWMQESGRANGLALASALIPVSGAEGSGGFYWAPLLESLAGECELCYDQRGVQREEFDLSFGAALDLLY